MQRRISLQSQGKLPSRALGLPPGPLPHRDEIDHIVQVHADSQATVVARPMARENFDAPTTTPNDVDETGRLRRVHQVADMGSGNAEPIGYFHVGDRGSRIARIPKPFTKPAYS